MVDVNKQVASATPGEIREILADAFRIPVGTLRRLERGLPHIIRKPGRGGHKFGVRETVDVLIAVASEQPPVTIDLDVAAIRGLILNPNASHVEHLPGYEFSKQVQAGACLERLLLDFANHSWHGEFPEVLLHGVSFIRAKSGPVVEVVASLGDKRCSLRFGPNDPSEYFQNVIRITEIRGTYHIGLLAWALFGSPATRAVKETPAEA